MKYLLAVSVAAGLLAASATAFAGPVSGLGLNGVHAGATVQTVDYYHHHRHWHHRRWSHHHWHYW